jgi:wyosine [tRNA(Phe)-imidazoG37] synthetase (radical SAM superfamily)
VRIYGPVPSRRFGLSLGIDVTPHKRCTFDCVYCQLGPTAFQVAEPADFFTVEEVVADVEEALEQGPTPDVLTFAGSGEPTLYRPLGALIDRLREVADIPILMITNSSLFWREEVAEAVSKVDILAPSLDAGDAGTYARINRPHAEISYERLLDGLRRVTHGFAREIRLEVMLLRDVNDDEESLRAIAARLEEIRFDQVDVNTPVRPPVPERNALPCDEGVLARALELFGPTARAIGTFDRRPSSPGKKRSFEDLDKDIRGMLLRRPCTADDISASLGLAREQVIRSLARLTEAGLVDSRPDEEGGTYFHVSGVNPTILEHR